MRTFLTITWLSSIGVTSYFTELHAKVEIYHEVKELKHEIMIKDSVINFNKLKLDSLFFYINKNKIK